jgi:spore coat polysaccharide biosynthesis protein SpsF
MGSKRLPGKVLLPLNGHTVLAEVIARCWKIPGIDLVAITTPDRVIWDYVAQRGLCLVHHWLGDENDLIGRYLDVAQATAADIIVRITADCPLISPELCGEVVNELKVGGADYTSNVTEPRTFPQGYDCEAFTIKTLNRAVEHGPDEHVTTWMRRGMPDVSVTNIASHWPLEGRLTLDTEDDYRTICAYFGHEPYQHLRAA